MKILARKPGAYAALALAVVLVFGLGSRGCSAFSSRHAASVVASAMSERRWADIYEMASPTELREQSWGKTQFIGLMEAATKHLPRSLGGCTWKEIGSVEPSFAGYLFRFENVKDVPADRELRSPFVFVAFYRDQEAWRPGVAKLALQFNGLGKETKAERMRQMLRSMDDAKVTDLYDVYDHTSYSRDRLRLAVAGKIDPDYVSLPRY